MANVGSRLIRITPGPTASPSPVTVNGRTYANPGAGATIDVPYSDGLVCAANGYKVLGMVGTTAQRPELRDPDFYGGQWWTGGVLDYFDSTLAVWIFWDPSSATGWRNLTTLAAV